MNHAEHASVINHYDRWGDNRTRTIVRLPSAVSIGDYDPTDVYIVDGYDDGAMTYPAWPDDGSPTGYRHNKNIRLFGGYQTDVDYCITQLSQHYPLL